MASFTRDEQGLISILEGHGFVPSEKSSSFYTAFREGGDKVRASMGRLLELPSLEVTISKLGGDYYIAEFNDPKGRNSFYSRSGMRRPLPGVISWVNEYLRDTAIPVNSDSSNGKY